MGGGCPVVSGGGVYSSKWGCPVVSGGYPVVSWGRGCPVLRGGGVPSSKRGGASSKCGGAQ